MKKPHWFPNANKIMGSPMPDAIKYKIRRNDDGSPPTKEQVRELYKNSYRNFIQNFTVQNQKVRYYCNKTMQMRQPLHAIVDDLINVQRCAMAYLDQEPRESDHFLLASTITMIQKVANSINWKALGHKCYWKDFCRELTQLRQLIEQAEVANLECCHTVVEKAERAMEILEEFRPETNTGPKSHYKRGDEVLPDDWDVYLEKMENSPLGFSGIQQNGPPLAGEMKIVCDESSDTMEWLDPESMKIQSAKLLDTSDSFRIRVLRSLIYCAYKSLQTVILTMSRTEITLRTEFSLEKLVKCDGLNPCELLPHERIVLAKSKKEFDSFWECIKTAVGRFRLHFIQLKNHDKVLKRLARNPKYSIQIGPKPRKLNLKIFEPILFKFAFEAEPEELLGVHHPQYMYRDRTSDVINMIQDMWGTIDKTNFKTIDVLIMLSNSALTQVFEVLSGEEKVDTISRLDSIFVQRDKIKRYLKKSIKVFGHQAFQDLPTIHNAKRFKSYTKIRPSKIDPNLENWTFDESSEKITDEEVGDSYSSSIQVYLQGGFNVSLGERKEFFVTNIFKDRSEFLRLTEEEQVIVSRKMLTSLYHFLKSEACFSKNVFARASETKSLMKRLEPKDRINEAVIIKLTDGLSHVNNTIRLMNEMNALLTFFKKV